MTLVEYLSQLNTCESQWGLWVNPENLDDYRISQYCFENGGIYDEKVHIGSLESLSYGYQSMTEVMESYLCGIDFVQYNGRKVKIAHNSILEAYKNDLLDEDFREFLEDSAQDTKDEISLWEAKAKIEELEIYFAPGGEWEKENLVY